MDAISIQSYGEHELADVDTGKSLMEALSHYYPNHNWFVETRTDAGVAYIQLLYQDALGILRRWNWGMTIHLKNLHSHESTMKYARNFGGELLERWRLKRSGASPETAQLAREHLLDTGIA